jgi:hypothetical protein
MRLLILSIALLLCRPAYADAPWEVIDHTKEGYEIATRREPTRELPSLRARGELEGDIIHLLAILLDAPRTTEWAEGADTVSVLKRKGPLATLVYTYSNLAWPVSDRDLVMKAELKVLKHGEEYLLDMHGAPELMPKKAGVVRITDALIHFHIKKRASGKVWIEYQINADPGGSLPTWLLTWLTKKVPRETLQKLQKQLESTRNEYGEVKAEILSLS